MEDTGLHEGTRCNNVVARDETNAARHTIRYSADAADAKSCKAEETKQRIETDGETINRDRAMQIKCKQYVGIPGRKQML